MERLYLLLPTLPKESKEQFNTDSTIHGTQATLLVHSHVWNQRVQRPRQGWLDNHSGVSLFQGYCNFTVD